MKLKPCPFCGSHATYNDDIGQIMCDNDNKQGGSCGFYFESVDGYEKAARFWNRRPEKARAAAEGKA